jgi:MFS family permease
LGRFLAGLSAGGSFALVPLYIAEISQDHIRGSLGSFFILSTNLGMLFVYVAGYFFDYFTTPKIMILLPISFIVLFSAFPDTPIYLLRQGKHEEAERSLKFLRCVNKEKILPEAAASDLQKMIRKVNSDAVGKHGSIFNELSEQL